MGGLGGMGMGGLGGDMGMAGSVGDMGMAGPGGMGMGGLGGGMGMGGLGGGMGMGGLGGMGMGGLEGGMGMGMGGAQMNGVDGGGGNWPYDPATQMQLGGMTPDFTGKMNGKCFLFKYSLIFCTPFSEVYLKRFCQYTALNLSQHYYEN